MVVTPQGRLLASDQTGTPQLWTKWHSPAVTLPPSTCLSNLPEARGQGRDATRHSTSVECSHHRLVLPTQDTEPHQGPKCCEEIQSRKHTVHPAGKQHGSRSKRPVAQGQHVHLSPLQPAGARVRLCRAGPERNLLLHGMLKTARDPSQPAVLMPTFWDCPSTPAPVCAMGISVAFRDWQ